MAVRVIPDDSFAPTKDDKKYPFPIEDIPLPLKQCYKGNILIKSAYVNQVLTPEHEAEILKCAVNPAYFIENYIRIVSLDEGVIPFKMFKYQKKMLQGMVNNRWSLFLLSRQAGKTTIVAAYLLWFALFHKSKTIAIMANKGDQAQEIMDRIRQSFEALPFFMQPGIRVYNKRTLLFDNGTKIFSAAANIRGRSCVTGDSIVTVRDKETGDVSDVRIDSLMNESSCPVFDFDDMMSCVNHSENKRYEVLTANGFKDFEAIAESHKESQYRIVTESGLSLQCTHDHMLMVNGEWIQAESIFPDDMIETDCGLDRVVEIEKVVGGLVYDLVGVKDVSSYYTNCVLSHNCDCLYIDEAAHIERDMEFYESTYPVISSGENSRVIMTTTPKGARGMFYKLWKESEAGINSYVCQKYNWSHHPKRDAAWAELTRGNIGPQRFRQEFEVEFMGSSKTLIGPDCLERLQFRTPLNDDAFTRVFEEPIPDHEYVALVDPSEGVGQDYSTVQVIDVSVKPYKQVCTYSNNTISPTILPFTAVSIAKRYNDALLLIESNNDMGGQVCYITYYELEYENMLSTSSDDKGLDLKMYGRNSKPGVRTTKRTKSKGCINLRTLVENDEIEINDEVTISELGSFVESGASYKADADCHDDHVMPLVMFGWLVKQPLFMQMTNRDLKESTMQNVLKEAAINSVIPFGFFAGSAPATNHGPFFMMGGQSSESVDMYGNRIHELTSSQFDAMISGF